MKTEKTKGFCIHTRAWGTGAIIFTIGLLIILVQESHWFWFFVYVPLLAVWIVWKNEKLPGGVKK